MDARFETGQSNPEAQAAQPSVAKSDQPRQDNRKAKFDPEDFANGSFRGPWVVVDFKPDKLQSL